MTVKVEFVGGPRDGLVTEYELDEFDGCLLAPVDPTFHPEELLAGTWVHVWEGPEIGQGNGRPLKCRYVGQRKFGEHR